ncbi:aminoglycoside 6-adenylyltransferase [Sporosarcina trichiuri]|uniref:aminoglycoside 6-adenylyltransferase n=1 Tax=Sporosarcina trichiuri TaxID=3056445 RepID=UPI0025B296A0|nr:aminoglycoside 6-adenylyltransferase [Sporosarcina sp. 0.2-SM1T-5]WJY28300.1 aminoglycoside 6-adenylyltransferase [Sporosarcina sp. 0.2-SM1T-5]
MGYSESERQQFLERITEEITLLTNVEGVVQIGSGVDGFSDLYSDIDLMVGVSNSADPGQAKTDIKDIFEELRPLYIKEKQFSADIHLLIVFLDNGLEFNVSVAPLRLLPVKSPLWKILVDKTGAVAERMNQENKRFEQEAVQYETGIDLPFEFAYCAHSAKKALNRNNPIYALQMLETMRTYLLYIQAMNEQKKVHQFKAYNTLDPEFVSNFLSIYPTDTSVGTLKAARNHLILLFKEVVQKSPLYNLDGGLVELLEL